MRTITIVCAAALAAFALYVAAAEPELEGNCAMSAALGHRLPTTCSVVWISPEDKLYCFSSENAKQAFMQDPAGNERKAQAFWKDPAFWERLKQQEPKG